MAMPPVDEYGWLIDRNYYSLFPTPLLLPLFVSPYLSPPLREALSSTMNIRNHSVYQPNQGVDYGEHSVYRGCGLICGFISAY